MDTLLVLRDFNSGLDFVFSNLEIPESIALGGAQALATHKFPGGARTVQSMGADHDPIEWSGLFLGSTALDRAKYLDFLRVQGLSLNLTFFDSNYTVVIQRFRFNVERYYKVGYSISLEVVADNAQPVTSIAPAGFDAAIGADCASMTQLGLSIGNVGLSASISSLSSACLAIPSFAGATTAQVNNVLNLAAGVTAQVATLKASCQATINSAGVLGGVTVGAVPGIAAASLSAQNIAGNQYPILQNIGNLSARVTKNVTNANLQSSTRTVQVGGGTLFDVAAAQYGDPTQWSAIAKASGLTDPALVGVQTLTIPANPAASGGVLTK